MWAFCWQHSNIVLFFLICEYIQHFIDKSRLEAVLGQRSELYIHHFSFFAPCFSPVMPSFHLGMLRLCLLCFCDFLIFFCVSNTQCYIYPCISYVTWLLCHFLQRPPCDGACCDSQGRLRFIRCEWEYEMWSPRGKQNGKLIVYTVVHGHSSKVALHLRR